MEVRGKQGDTLVLQLREYGIISTGIPGLLY